MDVEICKIGDGEGAIDPAADVVVATHAHLTLGTFDGTRWDMAVVDEAHHCVENAARAKLDALDAPLHSHFDTNLFEAGPSNDIPTQLPEAALAPPPRRPTIRRAWSPNSTGCGSAPTPDCCWSPCGRIRPCW